MGVLVDPKLPDQDIAEIAERRFIVWQWYTDGNQSQTHKSHEEIWKAINAPVYLHIPGQCSPTSPRSGKSNMQIGKNDWE